jgi:hypothetical protein
MTEAIWVAIIGGASASIGYVLKLLVVLRRENTRDHATVVSRLDQLITGHEHLDGQDQPRCVKMCAICAPTFEL